MKQRNTSLPSANVTFPDPEEQLRQLRRLAQEAIARDERILAIYLFGSRATGAHSARSDADLLIVLRESPHRRVMDRIPEYLRLFLRAPMPVDVFPFTEAEIKTNTFAKRAMQEGVLLAEDEKSFE